MAPLALLACLLQHPDTLHAPVADAYADPAAAVLMAAARAARDRNERLVTAYTATVKQRIGVGIRALSRDRMLYRQELVAQIAWQRDAPSTIEVLGAREGVPVAIRGDRVPDDLGSLSRGLIINPAQDYLQLIGRGDDGFVYPLREGSEADYRFASGDTTTITLAMGKRIRLLALQVTPRRADWRLIAGTLWFDAETFGLVQAVFRPARPYEFRRDADPDDRKDVPGFINATGEVTFVTLEYALYENRWWMPRYMALDVSASMGSWLNVPVKVERVYEDYDVEGGTPPPPGSTFRPAGTIRTDADRAERDSLRTQVRQCVAEVQTDPSLPDTTRRARTRACRSRGGDNLVVRVPQDTMALLAHPALGPPILAMGDLITEEEIRGLRGAIADLPSPMGAPRIALPHGVGALLQHARYNRIEALSLGVGGVLRWGPQTVRGVVRIGAADQVPNAEIAIARTTGNTVVGVEAYRRLEAANPETRPFGPVNSVLGLLAHRDDGQYYRATGGALRAGNANSGWWHARVFAQRERAATVETDASFPDLFGSNDRFQPNIAAERMTLYGGGITVRGTKAISPAVTLGGEMTLDGAVGGREFARGAATTRLYLTPSGPLAGALVVSAGSSRGPVPVPHQFYLGGAATLRGYAGGVTAGNAFWMSRLEVGNSFPAARLVAFTDAGWAGDRGAFGRERALIGAGVGVSFADGLFRIDLARGLRRPTGWRLEFYADGIL